MSPILIVITLLVIIVTPTTLQPSVATANYTTADIPADTPDNPFFHMTVTSNQSTSTVGDKTNVTLRVIFTTVPNEQGNGNWNIMLQPALDELNRRHPEMNIQIEYAEPYNEYRNSILDTLSNGDPVDIISLDQIWLGEFAEKGLIRNLMNLSSGVEWVIYMKQILMAPFTTTPYMVCGYGPMLEVCGIGRTCCKKQELIRNH